MAPSIGNNRPAGSPVPQRGNRARPVVVPAIPLPYLQHQRRTPVVPAPPKPAPAQEEVVLTRPSEEPNSLSPVPAANQFNVMRGNVVQAPPTPEAVDAAARMAALNFAGTLDAQPAYYANGYPQGMAFTPFSSLALCSFSRATTVDGRHALATPNGPVSDSPPTTVRPSVPATFPLPPSETFAFQPHTFHGALPPGLPHLPPAQYHGLHQPHMSNGTVHFGSLESNSTSPTPNSAGIFPAPALPYMGAPPPNEWDRSYGPFPGGVNGFPAMPSGFGASSPPSFHGSQSSLHNEENGYPQNPALNGQSPYGVAPAHNHRRMGPPGFLSIDPRQAQGIFGQVQQGFGDGEFADCELRIQFKVDPDWSPAEVANRTAEQDAFSFLGHRLILGQSGKLQALFRQKTPPRTTRTQHYHLELADPYVTSGSVYVAFGAMYGLRLEDVPVATNDARGRGRALDGAIALVAIGDLLDLPYVSVHGVAQAARLVDWANIDKALTFCLGGAANLHLSSPKEPPVVLPCSEAVFKYGKGFGEHIRELLLGLMEFIVQNFPANFALDTAVADASYGRIRLTPLSTPKTTPARLHDVSVKEGAESNGAANQAGPERRPPTQRYAKHRLAHIRFGDVSPPAGEIGDAAQAVDEGPVQDRIPSPAPSPTDPVPSEPVDTVLSRILLSLPIDFLRYVMEHPQLRGPSAWVTPDARHSILHDVVGERETRRLRAVAKVRAAEVQDHDSILMRLEAEWPPTPSHGADADVLGWKEEVVPGPRAIHGWQPLAAAAGGTR